MPPPRWQRSPGAQCLPCRWQPQISHSGASQALPDHPSRPLPAETLLRVSRQAEFLSQPCDMTARKDSSRGEPILSGACRCCAAMEGSTGINAPVDHGCCEGCHSLSKLLAEYGRAAEGHAHRRAQAFRRPAIPQQRRQDCCNSTCMQESLFCYPGSITNHLLAIS